MTSTLTHSATTAARTPEEIAEFQRQREIQEQIEAPFKDDQGHWKPATMVSYWEQVQGEATLRIGSVVSYYRTTNDRLGSLGFYLVRTLIGGHLELVEPKLCAFFNRADPIALARLDALYRLDALSRAAL